MKGAIASVEIFVFTAASAAAAAAESATVASPADRSDPSDPREGVPRRLSLVIGTPERAPGGDRWQCRVALADLHRPETCEGRDSVEALVRAVERARAWIAALHAEGFQLSRDRVGAEPFRIPEA